VRGTTFKTKSKRWGYIFDLPRGEDGKRRQQCRKGFTTEREADAALRKAIEEVETGEVAPTVDIPTADAATVAHTIAAVAGTDAPAVIAKAAENVPAADPLSFRKFFDDWFEQISTSWSDKTIEINRSRANYALRLLGDVPLQELNDDQIEKALTDLRKRGGRKTDEHPEGRPLSYKTVSSIGQLIGQSLKKAKKKKLIAVNPFLDLDPLHGQKKEVQILQLDDFEKLLARIRTSRYFCFCVFAAATGCRRGEQLALRWSDVDWSGGLISFSKSLSQTKAQGLRVKTTKSGKSRLVRIGPDALAVLSEWRSRIESERSMFAEAYRDDLDLVFPTPDGNYLSPAQVTNRIGKYMKKAKVRGSLHKLRHLNASVMISNKVPITEVSRRLGHSDTYVTLKVYSHAMSGDDGVASAVVDNAMGDVLARVGRPATNSRSVPAVAKTKVVGIEAGKTERKQPACYPASTRMLSGESAKL